MTSEYSNSLSGRRAGALAQTNQFLLALQLAVAVLRAEVQPFCNSQAV